MLFFLSKFLPLFLYPTGLSSLIFLILILTDLWNRSWSFRSWLALVGFLVITLGGNFYIAHWISHSLESQYPPLTENPEADAIVILGGGLRPGLPPRQHPEVDEAGDRIIHGAFLFHKGYAPLIVNSGGWVSLYWESGDRSEAADMQKLLKMLGVPEENMLLETRSQNTQENALFTAELLADTDINRIVLVTTARHMPRAKAVFEKQGFEVIPAPTDYFVTGEPDITNRNIGKNFKLINLPPKVKFLVVTTESLREYVGLAYYRLRGWI